MKKYIALIAFLVFCTLYTSNAQIIDSVKILPPVIYDNDTVTFIDFVTLGYIYSPGNDSLQKNGNLDRMQRYYYLSGFDQFVNGSDTVKLGTFQPGTYEVLFLASACYDSTLCTPFDTAIVHFTVLGPNSVNDISGDIKFTVYPNPSSKQLHLSLTSSQSDYFTINLFNNVGQPVKELFNGNTTELERDYDISDLNAGMYYLQAVSPSKNQTVKIIIIK